MSEIILQNKLMPPCELLRMAKGLYRKGRYDYAPTKRTRCALGAIASMAGWDGKEDNDADEILNRLGLGEDTDMWSVVVHRNDDSPRNNWSSIADYLEENGL